MQQGTGQIAKANDGSIWEYAAPQVIPLYNSQGVPASGVTFGEEQTIPNGGDLPAGSWELISGTLQSIGGPTVVRQIIIG